MEKEEKTIVNVTQGRSPSLSERNHKDTLFQLAFNDDREAALSLYNAVNGSDHTDASSLELTLLDGGFFMRMQNDNGFIFDHYLNLYEHQSTLNENMPLRGLLYFAELYKKIIPEKKRLYQKKLIKIPTPKYIVFYNGIEDMGGDSKLLKLSDAFEKIDETHGYEWSAIMLNINLGHNPSLMTACKMLSDYSQFVDKVRQYTCFHSLHNAIIKAVDECLEADIFTKVLRRYKGMISEIEMLREFNEADYKEFIREEMREEICEEMREILEEEKKKAASAETELLAATHILISTLKENNTPKEDVICKIKNSFPSLADKAEELVNSIYQ